MVRSHETIDQMEKPIVRVLEPEWADIKIGLIMMEKPTTSSVGIYNEHLQ